MAAEWIDAGAADALGREDVMRFDHDGKTFAIYRTADDRYHATDGFCTHAKVHLAGGFVMENTIECPKHNGRFDFKTGRALGAPACVNLLTHKVKIESGRIFLHLPPPLSP